MNTSSNLSKAMNILSIGEIVRGKWKVTERIGEGTYSQIFAAKSLVDGTLVAIKVERPSSLKPVLDWESCILQSLQHSSIVCRYYDHGPYEGNIVLIMELLGESMSKIRQGTAFGIGLPLHLCIQVGLEMLDCISIFHQAGYIHRDIKASNFVSKIIKPDDESRHYVLIDFGLSRKYVDANGNLIKPRERAEFRGTSLFASLQAHYFRELGCVDDLWSWLFVLVDFMRGELPWFQDAQEKNRETVEKLKQYYTETRPEELVMGLKGSSQLLKIMEHLRSLGYEDMPNYKLLKSLVKEMGSELHFNLDSPKKEKNIESRIKEELIEAQDLSIDEKGKRWCSLVHQIEKEDDLLSSSYSIQLLNILKESNDYLVLLKDFDVSKTIHKLEKVVEKARFAPPKIRSFHQKRQDENHKQIELLKRRRESDRQIRTSIEQAIKKSKVDDDKQENVSQLEKGKEEIPTPLEGEEEIEKKSNHSATTFQKQEVMEMELNTSPIEEEKEIQSDQPKHVENFSTNRPYINNISEVHSETPNNSNGYREYSNSSDAKNRMELNSSNDDYMKKNDDYKGTNDDKNYSRYSHKYSNQDREYSKNKRGYSNHYRDRSSSYEEGQYIATSLSDQPSSDQRRPSYDRSYSNSSSHSNSNLHGHTSTYKSESYRPSPIEGQRYNNYRGRGTGRGRGRGRQSYSPHFSNYRGRGRY